MDARPIPGPGVLEADLRSIPLPDFFFDCRICNAVVEHAGPHDQQVALVHEVCRVCRKVMFIRPNRGFPLELHTFLPVLHWLPDSAFRAALRRIGLNYFFADVENLNLLDAMSFEALFPAMRHNRWSQAGLSVPTNLICISTTKPA